MESVLKVLSKDPVSTELEKLNFEIINIGYLDNPDSKVSPVAILHNFKMLILLEGTANIYIGEDVRYIEKGDCVIFAPGSLYHAKFLDGENCSLISLNFTPSTPIQSKLFSDILGIKDIIIYPKLVNENVTKHIMGIYKDVIADVPGSYYRVQLMLKRLISSITYNDLNTIISGYHKQGNTNEEKIVLKCHNYLLNNPSVKVSVEDLCTLCNVSQSYLYKCFKNILAVSTKDYIIDTKINIAQKMLLQSDKSIATIAYETGFNNAYHFSNVFKAECGISPSIYRKTNK